MSKRGRSACGHQKIKRNKDMTGKTTKQIIIFSLLIIIVGVWAISAAAAGSEKPSSDKIISPEDAGKLAQDIVNNYFAPNKNAKISGATTEESGLYKVILSVDSNEQPAYLTKDGKFLIFPNGMVDIAKFEEQAKKQKEKPPIPKTDRPRVELYVMSLCPYGVKAEKEILPVINNFGDRIDFEIKYIVNIKGPTINEVESLHGPDEVQEDMRQAAIWRYYPDKFLPYLEKIKEKSCLISCGEVKLDDYWKQAANALQVDTTRIEFFTKGQEGMELLKQNEAAAKKYGADASPTLVINGVKSEAVYAGPKAVQEAIDSAFIRRN